MPAAILEYHLLHVLKFCGVMLYGGGAIASFVAGSRGARRRTAHALASPGLAMTWLGGYLLTLQLGIPLSELWITGGLALSLLSQLALVRSAGRAEASPSAFDVASVLLPLFFVLVLMVFRPTWSSLTR